MAPYYIHIFIQSTLNFEIALLCLNTIYYFDNPTIFTLPKAIYV